MSRIKHIPLKVPSLNGEWRIPTEKPDDNPTYYTDIDQLQNYIMNSKQGVTNNARVFYCDYRIVGAYDKTDLIAGATLNGMFISQELQSGGVVLLESTSNAKYNGLWEIQPAGDAKRWSKADNADKLFGCLAMIGYGDYSTKMYRCFKYVEDFNEDPKPFVEVRLIRADYQTTGISNIVYSQWEERVIVNSDAETSVIGFPITIPANTLAKGDKIVIELMGVISTQTNTVQSKIVMRLNGGTDIMDTGMQTLHSNALSDVSFSAKVCIDIKTDGVSGKLVYIANSLISTDNGYVVAPIMRAKHGWDKDINTTEDNTLDLCYQFSEAHANNKINIPFLTISIIKGEEAHPV